MLSPGDIFDVFFHDVSWWSLWTVVNSQVAVNFYNNVIARLSQTVRYTISLRVFRRWAHGYFTVWWYHCTTGDHLNPIGALLCILVSCLSDSKLKVWVFPPYGEEKKLQFQSIQNRYWCLHSTRQVSVAPWVKDALTKMDLVSTEAGWDMGVLFSPSASRLGEATLIWTTLK